MAVQLPQNSVATCDSAACAVASAPVHLAEAFKAAVGPLVSELPVDVQLASARGQPQRKVNRKALPGGQLCHFVPPRLVLGA